MCCHWTVLCLLAVISHGKMTQLEEKTAGLLFPQNSHDWLFPGCRSCASGDKLNLSQTLQVTSQGGSSLYLQDCCKDFVWMVHSVAPLCAVPFTVWNRILDVAWTCTKSRYHKRCYQQVKSDAEPWIKPTTISMAGMLTPPRSSSFMSEKKSYNLCFPFISALLHTQYTPHWVFSSSLCIRISDPMVLHKKQQSPEPLQQASMRPERAIKHRPTLALVEAWSRPWSKFKLAHHKQVVKRFYLDFVILSQSPPDLSQ